MIERSALKLNSPKSFLGSFFLKHDQLVVPINVSILYVHNLKIQVIFKIFLKHGQLVVPLNVSILYVELYIITLLTSLKLKLCTIRFKQ